MSTSLRGLFAALVFSLVAGIAPPASSSPPTASVGLVGTLTVDVPSTPSFVVHGTLPVPVRPFDRMDCPFVVLAPDGTPLNTQWELVASLEDFLIVELRAFVPINRWSGRKVFPVIHGSNTFNYSAFDSAAVALVATPNLVDILIQHQLQGVEAASLSGLDHDVEFHRLGPNTITARRHVNTRYGGVHAWFTIEAGSPHVELVLNWHNGGLPARPDAYFRSAALFLPTGWTWTPIFPDPIAGSYYLVQPNEHVLPQRMERSFRLILHPVGDTPDLERGGWGVADWSNGGYLAQSFPLPNLDHAGIDLSGDKWQAYNQLGSCLPTIPGDPPVSPLWPARGVYYGGMTGGIDIDQVPGVPTAVSGQANGLLTLYVEQLRYASRQMGCIYQPDGHPIELEDYLNPDGTTPWTIFNNAFQGGGSPPWDEPFLFSATGPGDGNANYDPLIFQPIDCQHLVRRTKANKALVWLDNDPLARMYLTMDAELQRMAFYEGPGGTMEGWSPIGLGSWWGRGEAWVADLLATAYAINDTRWRNRNSLWLWKFVDNLRRAQLPSGLFTAKNDGKTAEDPPYGDGNNAFYWVGRSNEQAFLILALRGIQETTGLDASDPIRKCALGLWHFAWKVGTTGPLDRYPAGPVGGPRYTYRSEIPPGLTDSVPRDGWHVAGALAAGALERADIFPAVLAYCGTADLSGARAAFESWGLDNIANRAVMLRILQFLNF